ncbi:tyrosine-type recombinase/integrase [Duganella sp. FT135W]|uniref:Tyrosine-type recombinase/integrase n=1 Tax=Duganella flavida TaxID=2692175 RepID=A0A6L8K5K3_9BURK|nr:tyrosine-type recombinase/integrase [Duganella flavida]MYM22666.1 tyrosine-type recombinase/integrase [Duganella flavida]
MINVRPHSPVYAKVFRTFFVLNPCQQQRAITFIMATKFKIDTVGARAKLRLRREPYWHRIRTGNYLGYRKISDESAGSWLVRWRTAGNRQRSQPLGTFEEIPAFQRFDHALAEAESWLHPQHREKRQPNDVIPNVLAVCLAYVEKIRDEKGNTAADEVQARYRNWIEPDPIGSIIFRELTADDVKAWRARMINTPVRGKAGKAKPRSLDTVNRDLAPVRAAFNQAHAQHLVDSDAAWINALKAFKDVAKSRDVYLDVGQRCDLIDNSAADFARFATGLSKLPARPGALAHLKVGSFESRLDVLTIGKDKAGRDRKVKLPKALADFIREIAGDRPADEPLFVRECGEPWDKESWKRHLRRAASAASLPDGTVLMALRHSTITDMVLAGHNLLTIAQISGTSVGMIEKNYGHLRPEAAVSALSALTLLRPVMDTGLE